MYLSSQFPGDTNPAVLRSPLWKPLLWSNPLNSCWSKEVPPGYMGRRGHLWAWLLLLKTFNQSLHGKPCPAPLLQRYLVPPIPEPSGTMLWSGWFLRLSPCCPCSLAFFCLLFLLSFTCLLTCFQNFIDISCQLRPLHQFSVGLLNCFAFFFFLAVILVSLVRIKHVFNWLFLYLTFKPPPSLTWQ